MVSAPGENHIAEGPFGCTLSLSLEDIFVYWQEPRKSALQMSITADLIGLLCELK